MPGRNGTGPAGMGATTGGGFGWCNPYWAGRVPARPFSGRGRGYRWMYYATGLPGWIRFGGYPTPAPQADTPAAPTAEQELSALRAQAQWFRSWLDAINARIAELEKKSK